MRGRKKIAFWFRYSPADHVELFPAIGALIKRLSTVYEVHYFGLRGARPIPTDMAQHCTLHLIPVNIRRSSTCDKIVKLIVWYAALPIIALRCRLMGIKAILINDYMPLSAHMAQVWTGAKVIMWVADFLHNVYATRSVFFRPIARAIDSIDLASWRRCPLIITLAESTRSYLTGKGIAEDRIIAVNDPCDATVYRPLPRETCRKKWGYDDSHVVLGHHGVLHPNKGIDRILRGIAPLMKETPPLRFLLIGSGPETARLKELASSLGIADRVQFTGWVKTSEEVNEAINAADISLVMRTGSESSDNFHTTSALVHNMSAGQPILSAKLGGISEIIEDGKNGFLFSPDDMEEFREKLTLLVEDPERRKAFGEAALTLARERFDIQAVVDRTAEPIQKALGD